MAVRKRDQGRTFFAAIALVTIAVVATVFAFALKESTPQLAPLGPVTATPHSQTGAGEPPESLPIGSSNLPEVVAENRTSGADAIPAAATPVAAQVEELGRTAVAAPTEAQLEVLVLSPDGEPAAGVQVFCTSDRSSSEGTEQVFDKPDAANSKLRTDENGRCVFASPRHRNFRAWAGGAQWMYSSSLMLNADDWVGMRTIQIKLTALPADCVIQGYAFESDGRESKRPEVTYYWKQSNGKLLSSLAESHMSSNEFCVRLKQPVEDGVLFGSHRHRRFPESQGVAVASGTRGVKLFFLPELDLYVNIRCEGQPVEAFTRIFVRVSHLGHRDEWHNAMKPFSANRRAEGNGTFKIQAPRTPFDMLINVEGYAPKLFESLHFDGMTAALEVDLRSKPAVTGRVTLSGIGLENARVSSNRTHRSTVTDEFGEFSLEYDSANQDKLKITHDTAGVMHLDSVQVPETGEVFVTANFPSLGQIWGDVLLPTKELRLTRPGLLMTHIKSRTTETIPIEADGIFRLDLAMPGKWKIALAKLHEEEELGQMGYLGDTGYAEVDAELPATKLVGKLVKIKHRRLSRIIRLQPGESKYLKLDFTK